MPKYIPLGSNCVVAYQLNKLGLRTEAYPFDWVQLINFQTIIDLLSDKFTGFYDLDNYTIKKKSDKYKLEKNGNISGEMFTRPIVINTKYKILMPHDFVSFDDYNDVINKYKRRINRFYNTIKTENDICFVVNIPNKKFITEEQVDIFTKLIKTINPEINIHIKGIYNGNKTFNISNIDFYRYNINTVSWEMDEIDWSFIYDK